MYICVILEILAQISVSSLKGLYATSGALWCYLMHWRSTQVFSFCKDNCCSDKRLYFWEKVAIQHQRQSCGIWGRGAVVATGGADVAMELQCWLWRWWVSVEGDKLRYLWAVEKLGERGRTRMIIGEILWLFLLWKLPIFLASFYLSPLCGGFTWKPSKKVMRDTRSWWYLVKTFI